MIIIGGLVDKNTHILWETKIRYLKILNKSLGYSPNNYDSILEEIHEVLPNKYRLFSSINDIKIVFKNHLRRLNLQIESNSRVIKEGLITQQQPEDIEIDANCRDQYTPIDLSWIDSLDKIIEDFLSEQIRTFS